MRLARASIREWLTAPLMYGGDIGAAGRIWNATRWRLHVSSELLMLWSPPLRFGVVRRLPDLDAMVFALIPLNLVMRAWYQFVRWVRWGSPS